MEMIVVFAFLAFTQSDGQVVTYAHARQVHPNTIDGCVSEVAKIEQSILINRINTGAVASGMIGCTTRKIAEKAFRKMDAMQNGETEL